MYVCSKQWRRCHRALQLRCSPVYSPSVARFCCRRLTEHVRTCSNKWRRCSRPAHKNVSRVNSISCVLRQLADEAERLNADVILLSCDQKCNMMYPGNVPCVGPGHPSSSLSIYFLIFPPFTFPFISLALHIFFFCPSLPFLPE